MIDEQTQRVDTTALYRSAIGAGWLKPIGHSPDLSEVEEGCPLCYMYTITELFITPKESTFMSLFLVCCKIIMFLS